MTKVQPIPEELWGAMNIVTSTIDLAIKITNTGDSRLIKANELISEYASCFGADGSISQRGEIPQCWNPQTIFTPHRSLEEEEVCREQMLLPFEEGDE
tara:strand:- start:3312 stop:3605 length:294 start_codon:yes stop_codon:yes gene_type:complete